MYDLDVKEEADKILGLKLLEYTPKETTISEEVTALIQTRDEARTNKNFAESDRLRKEIEDLGYEVEDSKEGTKVRRLRLSIQLWPPQGSGTAFGAFILRLTGIFWTLTLTLIL